MKAARYLPDRNRSLLAWQRPVLARMMGMQNPALFLDMRLGKCLLTIEFCIRKGLRKVLVLCPKTAIVSWRNELRLEGLDNVFILKDRPLKIAATTSTEDGWYLATIETINTVPLNLARWDAIVIDESSRIKSPKALSTRKLIHYYSGIRHKILLSGTPHPESIVETVPQLIYKDGSCLGCRTFWDFRARHMKLVGYDWALKPGVYERLNQLLHNTAIYLSQKKAGWDMTESREVIHFTLNAEQKIRIKELIRHFETTVDGKLYSTKYILPQTLWMMRIACGLLDGKVINEAKIKWLTNYLDRNREKQFIVWFAFNEDIKYVQAHLRKYAFDPAILWGDCDVDERIAVQKAFQCGDIRVLLIQTKLGKYSLDLWKADEAIYFSNTYSSEERMQSEKRICHTLRTAPPTYKDLVFDDSIEAELLEIVRGKKFSFRLLWDTLRIVEDRNESPCSTNTVRSGAESAQEVRS